MEVRNLLNKSKLITREIKNINFHINLLDFEIDELKYLFPEIKDKNNDEITEFVLMLFDKCNASSPNYDSNIDIKLTRYSFGTDKIHARNNNGIIQDENGYGDTYGDLYDHYVDMENGLKR